MRSAHALCVLVVLGCAGDRPRVARADVIAPGRDLGPLPSELAELRWPELPRIEREVAVSSAEALQRAVDAPHTRARVSGAIDDEIVVHASDVELVIEGRVERVVVDRGVHRVRISGGALGSVELLPPARFDNAEPEWDEALFVTDVTIEHVRMRASDSAFVIRGRRVAIVDCDVEAVRYSLWAGDTGPFDSSDLIVSRSRMRSAGSESTLRMHDVLRSVVVGTLLSNPVKHDYRVHGRSDLAYAARNVLLHSGMMFGTQPGDSVGTIIFEDNVLHHETPSLLEIEPAAIRRLVMRRNTVFTDRWEAFYPYDAVGEGWTIESNIRHPFRAYGRRS